MSAHRNSLSSLSTCSGSTFCFISGPLLKVGNCSSKVGSSFWQIIPMDIRSSHSRDSKFFSSLRNNSTIICHGPQLLYLVWNSKRTSRYLLVFSSCRPQKHWCWLGWRASCSGREYHHSAQVSRPAKIQQSNNRSSPRINVDNQRKVWYVYFNSINKKFVKRWIYQGQPLICWTW